MKVIFLKKANDTTILYTLFYSANNKADAQHWGTKLAQCYTKLLHSSIKERVDDSLVQCTPFSQVMNATTARL